ncbi:MAG: hypothetical protein JWN37_571 [Candidatus Nomurabacteria bacterium]|nr:hypothetical protein [Candidatus Nomurabacteria bacterium]
MKLRRKTDKLIVIIIIIALGVFFLYSYKTYDRVTSDLEINTPPQVIKYEYAETELPKSIQIPSLNIDTTVKYVGVTKDGNMATPGNFKDVGWYKYGTAPGFNGSAVIAGHLDNALAISGVFKNLKLLKEGDDVYITRNDGTKLHFKVEKTETYPYDNAPTEEIFNGNNGSRLNLITCAGVWNQLKKTYSKRLVVYAKLVNE